MPSVPASRNPIAVDFLRPVKNAFANLVFSKLFNFSAYFINCSLTSNVLPGVNPLAILPGATLSSAVLIAVAKSKLAFSPASKFFTSFPEFAMCVLATSSKFNKPRNKPAVAKVPAKPNPATDAATDAATVAPMPAAFSDAFSTAQPNLSQPSASRKLVSYLGW